MPVEQSMTNGSVASLLSFPVDADQRIDGTKELAARGAWVAEGKTNGEIGIIVGARPRTVAKHLERIFRKLGVETRTAAASALSLSAS